MKKRARRGVFFPFFYMLMMPSLKKNRFEEKNQHREKNRSEPPNPLSRLLFLKVYIVAILKNIIDSPEGSNANIFYDSSYFFLLSIFFKY